MCKYVEIKEACEHLHISQGKFTVFNHEELKDWVENRTKKVK